MHFVLRQAQNKLIDALLIADYARYTQIEGGRLLANQVIFEACDQRLFADRQAEKSCSERSSVGG